MTVFIGGGTASRSDVSMLVVNPDEGRFRPSRKHTEGMKMQKANLDKVRLLEAIALEKNARERIRELIADGKSQELPSFISDKASALIEFGRICGAVTLVEAASSTPYSREVVKAFTEACASKIEKHFQEGNPRIAMEMIQQVDFCSEEFDCSELKEIYSVNATEQLTINEAEFSTQMIVMNFAPAK